MTSRLLLLPAVLFAAAGVAMAQPAGTAPSTPAPKATPKIEPKKVEPKETSPTSSPDAAIKVGSKAPAIKVTKWVKGTEVKSFEPGKVYVVEFWATWCPPCKKSIPLLNELAKSHKDVTVIGVSIWEYTHKKSLPDVENFVRGKGEEMSYTVAFDGDRVMEKSWLAAAGVRGIPSAFVIGGDGAIAWNDNPLKHDEMMAAIDAALKAAKPATTSTPSTTTPPTATKPSTPATTTPPAPTKPKG
jgi:thiol-disulfide isomerase/thioredoxin